MNFQILFDTFKSLFRNYHSPRIFFAPGRINLIGEHTDYNGGHVFPAAISNGTYTLAVKRTDQLVRFYSMNFPEHGIITCDLADLNYHKQHDWANFPKGVFKYMIESGHSIDCGLDILFYGDIPNGAGLSSSASIEIATLVMLDGLFSFNQDKMDMIKLGQRVENDYIGVQSGIMDQFAIVMGRKNHAIHLDTKQLIHTCAPLPLKSHSIIIIHTNKQRTLADSKYNERRRQCEEALKDLQSHLSINYLCELTPESFEAYQSLISNPMNQRRAKHIVYENDRTKRALSSLYANDLQGFGNLMNESHVSLQKDYEVTGQELDTIAETAWKLDGVIGARMTGAGFGGCAIAIVHNDALTFFQHHITATYEVAIGYPPSFYIPEIADGAKEITGQIHQ